MLSYPSILTYLGAQKNHLIEIISFFEYPQHMFWLRNKKIIFLLHLCAWLQSQGWKFKSSNIINTKNSNF